ncbi:hypothetical protein VOLCADRAFT_90980 [Volvox carteri f. nagariensis]|uniref:Uncharacterized protein n=1 Tax=Volvox carteri f. nagariensis TaxID=3068 RepID=D8TVW0_VOLCA|nr:uncharacterized protein VOLCADRAFT_90980 [Volvox carteri f. nagariensis]EFJ48371.1 hypothetical protein VOLCADRAFT_90980 [Volvox carteri f. nagariensis]|eukprot:XP_002950625.1 hypothetical protein VOLCADRAFT_90980 [Volvox carteri f. nagariensis]
MISWPRPRALWCSIVRGPRIFAEFINTPVCILICPVFHATEPRLHKGQHNHYYRIMADTDMDTFLSLISEDIEFDPAIIKDVQHSLERNAQQFGQQRSSSATHEPVADLSSDTQPDKLLAVQSGQARRPVVTQAPANTAPILHRKQPVRSADDVKDLAACAGALLGPLGDDATADLQALATQLAQEAPESLVARTTKEYAATWRQYRCWWEAHNFPGDIYSTPGELVALYLLSLLNTSQADGVGPGRVRLASVAISTYFRMAGKATPTDHTACGIVRTLAEKRLHERLLAQGGYCRRPSTADVDVGPLLRPVQWMQRGGYLSGPLTGTWEAPVHSLSYAAFRTRLLRMVSLAGITHHIKAHSMGIGADRGVPAELRKAHGCWRTDAMVQHYTRCDTAAKLEVSRRLGLANERGCVGRAVVVWRLSVSCVAPHLMDGEGRDNRSLQADHEISCGAVDPLDLVGCWWSSPGISSNISIDGFLIAALALALFDTVEYPEKEEVDEWGGVVFEALRDYFMDCLNETKHRHDCHPQIDFEEGKVIR